MLSIICTARAFTMCRLCSVIPTIRLLTTLLFRCVCSSARRDSEQATTGKARQAAEESIESVKNMLSDGTKMVFITAGMGGGTGTGAAPVIARISKELGILTVGIVTIPFRFEGARKIDQALDGVEEMAKHVDALLVINTKGCARYIPNCLCSRRSARLTTR